MELVTAIGASREYELDSVDAFGTRSADIVGSSIYCAYFA